jgi:hypothetical protein
LSLHDLTPANRQFAVDLGAKPLKQHPGEARTPAALGNVYCQAYRALHKRECATKALAFYREFLKIEPWERKKSAWHFDNALKELEAAAK